MIEAITGFHGTFSDCVDEIINRGFKYTPRKDHWLGQGVYFYEKDIEQAKVWAKSKRINHAEYQNKLIAIIEAVIKVPQENFLNLNLRADCWFVEKFAKEMLTSDDFKLKLDSSKPAINRCLLFDYISRKRGIKVILAPFSHVPSHLKDLEKDAGVDLGLSFTEQQICVKETNTIFSPKCVYTEVEDVKKKFSQKKSFRKKPWR